MKIIWKTRFIGINRLEFNVYVYIFKKLSKANSSKPSILKLWGKLKYLEKYALLWKNYTNLPRLRI